MRKEGIGSDWPVFGPYSPGVKVAGVIWLAGQIAPDAGDIVEQTQASLDKIDVLLAAAGVTKHQVTFVQVLLDDINNFAALAQFDFYMQVQTHYTDHNTSATIEFRENEIEPLSIALHKAIEGGKQNANRPSLANRLLVFFVLHGMVSTPRNRTEKVT